MKGEGVRRLGQALRQGDLAGVAILASRGTLIARMDRMLVLMSPPLDSRHSIQTTRSSDARLTTRPALAGDLAEIVRLFPHNADRYAERMRQHDECMLILDDNDIIGMTWLGFDPDMPRELGCAIHLPGGSCWEYDTFVLAGHRKLGAFAMLMSDVFQRLASRGIHRVFAAVAHLNDVSRAAHGRLGYTTAGVIDRYQVLGIPFWKTTDATGLTVWRRREAGRMPVFRPERSS